MNNNRLNTGLTILMLLLTPIAGAVARQADQTERINLFPSRTFVRSFVADGTAHRFGVEKAFERNEVLGSIGGVLPVAELHLLAVPVQLSLGASAHMTLDPRERIAVMSTEYYIDFFMIDMLWSERLFTRVGMGHTSHHLGDNGAAALQNGSVLDYSRDYVQAVGGYDDGTVRLYAGANYAYEFVIGTVLRKPWLLTAGGKRRSSGFPTSFPPWRRWTSNSGRSRDSAPRSAFGQGCNLSAGGGSCVWRSHGKQDWTTGGNSINSADLPCRRACLSICDLPEKKT